MRQRHSLQERCHSYRPCLIRQGSYLRHAAPGGRPENLNRYLALEGVGDGDGWEVSVVGFHCLLSSQECQSTLYLPFPGWVV